MAINMSDKKSLVNQIIGQADITVTTSGITLSGPRLSTPRFIPFDESGRCRSCKATEVEVDTMTTKEGITLWCTRIDKTQFIPFDVVYDLPGHCFFRVKNKARVFNVQYSDIPSDTCDIQLGHQDDDDDERALKRKAKVALDLVEQGLIADAMQDNMRWKKAKAAFNVLGNLLLTESIDNSKKTSGPVNGPQQLIFKEGEQQQEGEEVNKQEEGKTYEKDGDNGEIDKTLDEFFSSIKASTTMM
uniref:Uncharacterized protein n=2 Tax=Globodera rostochiensis TaxID=31243 RepID=A0A914HAR6_GLORO